MRNPLQRSRAESTPPAEAPGGRLSGVHALSLDDEDDRPSREDMTYGETIFNRATVPLPRFLRGRSKRRDA